MPSIWQDGTDVVGTRYAEVVGKLCNAGVEVVVVQ